MAKISHDPPFKERFFWIGSGFVGSATFWLPRSILDNFHDLDPDTFPDLYPDFSFSSVDPGSGSASKSNGSYTLLFSILKCVN